MKTTYITAALILALSTGAMAQTATTPPPAKPAAPRGMMLSVATVYEPMFVRHIEVFGPAIGLSADQKQKISDLFSQSQSSLEPLKAAYNEAMANARKATYGDDPIAAKDAIEKVRKAEDAVIAMEAVTWDQIKAILTKEQLTKLSGITVQRGPTPATPASAPPTTSPATPAAAAPSAK